MNSRFRRPVINVTPPTITELAAMCNDIYEDPNNRTIPQGWVDVLYSDDNDVAFRGALYMKQYDDKLSCVIAHRGTVPSELMNIIGDIDFVLGSVMPQVPVAVDFYNKCLNYLEERFHHIDEDKFLLTLTGHSLGAVLSDANYALNKGDEITGLRSITFESPGSYPLIYRLIIDPYYLGQTEPNYINSYLKLFSKRFITYLADINIINSCSAHIGAQYRLTQLPYHYSPGSFHPMFPPTDTGISNLYYSFAYSFIDQHSITGIYNYMLTNGESAPTQNPIGIQNGYIAYLDFDSRNAYWRGYATEAWNTYPEFREQFNDDRAAYDQKFEYTVRWYQQEAKNKLLIEKPAEKIYNNNLVLFKSKKQIHEFELIEKPVNEKSSCLVM